MARPYTQQSDESFKAFEAFAVYRDLGSQRSLVATAEAMGKNAANYDTWSVRYRWVARARSYDQEIDRRKLLGDLQATEKMRRRQVAIALKLQALGLVELERAIDNATDLQKRGEPLDPKAIVKLIEAGSKLERLNRGEPSEIVQSRVDVAAVDLTGAPTEDLKAVKRLHQLIRAKQLQQPVLDTTGEEIKK